MLIRDLGLMDYKEALKLQHEFIINPGPSEIWLLQHPPTFTLGQAAKEGLLQPSTIPLVPSDRGGEITYHGPGQLIIYVLLELKQYNLNIRSLVELLEQTVINTLAYYGLQAYGKKEAPGVYIDGAKIASIGLRIKKGYSLHGLAFNVDMDLSPFSYINPCGAKDLKIIQLADFIKSIDMNLVKEQTINELHKLLALTHAR